MFIKILCISLGYFLNIIFNKKNYIKTRNFLKEKRKRRVRFIYNILSITKISHTEASGKIILFKVKLLLYSNSSWYYIGIGKSISLKKAIFFAKNNSWSNAFNLSNTKIIQSKEFNKNYVLGHRFNIHIKNYNLYRKKILRKKIKSILYYKLRVPYKEINCNISNNKTNILSYIR